MAAVQVPAGCHVSSRDLRGVPLPLGWEGGVAAEMVPTSVALGCPDVLRLQICFNELLVNFDALSEARRIESADAGQVGA